MTMILQDNQGRDLAERARPRASWWRRIGRSLRRETAKWFLGFTIALVSALSGHVTENFKLALNRANLRTDSYEALAQDVSEHVFLIDNIQEYLAHEWTTAKSLEGLINDYNASITKLRKREFVYRAQLTRFWPASARAEFTSCMAHVREIDVIIHSLNDELDAVVLKKTKDKMATERAHEAALRIEKSSRQLHQSVERLLED